MTHFRESLICWLVFPWFVQTAAHLSCGIEVLGNTYRPKRLDLAACSRRVVAFLNVLFPAPRILRYNKIRIRCPRCTRPSVAPERNKKRRTVSIPLPLPVGAVHSVARVGVYRYCFCTLCTPPLASPPPPTKLPSPNQLHRTALLSQDGHCGIDLSNV